MLKAEDNAMVDIKEWRQEFGITQQALAKASGLDVRWIQKVEAGDIDIMNVTVKRFTRESPTYFVFRAIYGILIM